MHIREKLIAKIVADQMQQLVGEIQKAHGITTGDIAAQYFSTNYTLENIEAQLTAEMIQYMQCERLYEDSNPRLRRKRNRLIDAVITQYAKLENAQRRRVHGLGTYYAQKWAVEDRTH